jgi:flavin-dependent dehydrogenase
MENVDVVIVGSSMAGLMTAAYLKQQMPILDVVVLGPRPEDEQRPIVGESLVEPAALFMQEIGLGEYLNSTQMTKYGLSFYHKIRPEDPLDRQYSVHAPHRLHHNAWQLHRPQVDCAVRARAAELGARLVTGRMSDFEIGTAATGHRVHAQGSDGATTYSCRWLIDATGRSRRIGKRVANYTRPRETQRNCFWFWLADFEPFLPNIEKEMRRPLAYDLWQTTHHFTGKGYWIWGIPLTTSDSQNLISVGITFRPDIFTHPMRNLEDFLEVVDQQHPALGAMVRSGKVLDTNVYHDYLYWSDKVYSADGWFLVGDAARAVDPLYSNGLSLTTVQAEQIGAIIQGQRDGELKPGDCEAMDAVWRRFMAREQGDISSYYEVMHDPFHACMRRYWNVCGWFNAFLPLWWNGFFSVPLAARLLARLLPEHDPGAESARKLFAHAAKALGPEPSPADFYRVPDIDWMINLRFDCPKEQLPQHLARTFWKRIRMRLALLRIERYRHAGEQLPALTRELASMLVLRFLVPWIGRRAFAALKSPLPRQERLFARGADNPSLHQSLDTGLVHPEQAG